MIHRVLFLHEDLKDPNDGGIQRVSYNLASYLRQKGHDVFFMAWRIDVDDHKMALPEKKMDSEVNKVFIRSFLRKEKITLVINQAGVSPETSRLAFEAKKEGAKLISCIHNTLLGHIENIESYYYPRLRKYHLDSFVWLLKNHTIKKAAYYLYIKKYHHHYISLCEKSDRVVLLSAAFLSELSQFTGNELALKKAIAIANPLSYNGLKKTSHEKKVLYVGRLENKQKRVDLLLKIWEKVFPQNPDWTLDVVGRGPDEIEIKKRAEELNLKNILFHGFTDPRPYYEKASVLCMTSSYEGFGVVLLEAMQYGVVPMAFNSYKSVTDLITDKENGILITPFNLEEYSRRLSELMSSDKSVLRMSKAAINKAKQFSIDEIGNQWDMLFETIN